MFEKVGGATRWSPRFFVWWHEVVGNMYQSDAVRVGGDLSRAGLIQGVETAWGSHFNQGDVGYAIASRSC